jgi:hypothetical protein
MKEMNPFLDPRRAIDVSGRTPEQITQSTKPDGETKLTRSLKLQTRLLAAGRIGHSRRPTIDCAPPWWLRASRWGQPSS